MIFLFKSLPTPSWVKHVTNNDIINDCYYSGTLLNRHYSAVDTSNVTDNSACGHLAILYSGHLIW